MRLYFDMDGVLCHFDKRACETWGFEPNESGWYDIEAHHWKLIEHNTEFWSHMEWQPGGKELWEATKDMNRWILSAYNPAVMKSTIVGKIGWINNQLDIPDWKAKLVMREDKRHFAVNHDGTRNVLIDDQLKNIQEWAAAGGVGIHHTDDVVHTIEVLDKIKNRSIDLTTPSVWGIKL